MATFDSYQSPFSWRYGSEELRSLWGERSKRMIWRRIWVAIAEAQSTMGLVTAEQVEDLRSHMGEVDVEASLLLEKTLRHDLVAELKVFAGQCPLGGGILHLGATSMDIKDNAEVLQIAKSLDLLIREMESFLRILADKVEQYASLPVIAFTHLQPAEPTTLGYRLAVTALDFLEDYTVLRGIRQGLKGKGLKGAVGNAAANVMLFGLAGQDQLEEQVSREIGLPFFEVSSQTCTRKQDYTVLAALAGMASTAHKFAFDLRILQSEVIGELAEPFGGAQVGSSAMPFKRNPVEAEKIDSLARAVSTAPLIAWNNYANSMLERTLDDSANRRTLLPESFLAMDEILTALTRILEGLMVNPERMRSNLEKFGQFAALERVIAEAVRNGADRQEVHEILRRHSMAAWEEIGTGESSSLFHQVVIDSRLAEWISVERMEELFDVAGYTGIAEPRAREMTKLIRSSLP